MYSIAMLREDRCELPRQGWTARNHQVVLMLLTTTTLLYKLIIEDNLEYFVIMEGWNLADISTEMSSVSLS